MKIMSLFLCLLGFAIPLYPALGLEKQLALFDTVVTSYQESMASHSRLRFALFWLNVEDNLLLEIAAVNVAHARSKFQSSRISLAAIKVQEPESKIFFDKFRKIEKSVYAAERYYKGSLNSADTPSSCCGLM